MLVGLSLAFMASSLSAEAFSAPSGYYGVVIRANGGAGFSKILRETSPSVLSEMDPVDGSYEGFTGTANVHFGIGVGSYTIHIGVSYLNLPNILYTRGLDIVEVTEGVASATHNIEVLSWLFGCTFYHVRSALYFTPEIRFLQNAKRTTRQAVEDDIVYEEITNYRSVIGVGITVGVDWWLSSFFAIGIGLAFYYDLLNIESNEINTIDGDIVTPVGDTVRNDPTNISYIFVGLVINLLIN